MASPVYVQSSFRGINDDGSLTTATFREALNTNFNEPLDQVFRLRFVIQNTANNADTGNQTFELWCSRNGGTYFQVTSASTLVQLANDANSIADNSATVQRIGTGTYTGIASDGYNDGTTDNPTGIVSIPRATEAEVECSLKLLTTGNANGDTFDFRLRRTTATVLNTYTTTPRVTAAVEAVPPSEGYAVLAATGSVSAVGLAVHAGSAGISAAGSIAATGAASHGGSAAVSAVGSIAAAGEAPVPYLPFAIDSATGAVTVDDPSGLSVSQVWDLVVRVTDDASQTDDADVSVTLTAAPAEGYAVLTATGSISAAGAVTHSGSATLAAAGSIVAAGAAAHSGSATLAAVGDLAAVGYSARSGSAVLESAASIAATGYSAASGSAALTAAASISAVGEAPGVVSPAEGYAALTVAGDLEAVGVAIHAGSAELAAVGSIQAAGVSLRSGSAILEAEASIAATGESPLLVPYGWAVIEAETSIEATGAVVHSGFAAVAANGSVEATGYSQPHGWAAIDAEAGVTATGYATRSGMAVIEASAAIEAAGVAAGAFLPDTITFTAGVIRSLAVPNTICRTVRRESTVRRKIEVELER